VERRPLTDNRDGLKSVDSGLDKRVLDRTRGHFIKRTNAMLENIVVAHKIFVLVVREHGNLERKKMWSDGYIWPEDCITYTRKEKGITRKI